MGKTRDLFKKTGDIKGTCHARIGTIKDRNAKDLTEEEEVARIRRRTIPKSLNDQDNHDGVVTHLVPETLKSEVKWTLRGITMNKASGSDEIPAELSQILKDNAVKMLQSLYQQIWKTQQWLRKGLEKVSFHSNPK